MGIKGKIKTLFSDVNKEKAIFPRTKVKAVSDENGVGLDVLLADLPTKNFVTSKIAEAQLGGGGGGGNGEDIDLSGYATKDDIENIDFPVDSINGKTGDVQLNASDVGARPNNWMPTAEQVGARPNTWIPTAEQVGARPSDWMPTADDIGCVTQTEMETYVNNTFLGGEW